jgi:hypothetical protein
MLKLIAALEVIGGLLGFGFLYSYAWARYGFAFSSFNLLSISFFSLCLVAGTELWRGTRRGFWLSLAAQLPQVLMFSTLSSGFKLQAGLQALLMVEPSGARVWFGFGAESLLAPDAVERQLVALNLVPLVWLGLLLVKRKGLRAGPATELGSPTRRAA